MEREWALFETKKIRNNGYVTLPNKVQEEIVYEHPYRGEMVQWGIVEDEDRGEKYAVLSGQEVENYIEELKETQVSDDDAVRPPSQVYDIVGVDDESQSQTAFLADNRMLDNENPFQYSYFLYFDQILDIIPGDFGGQTTVDPDDDDEVSTSEFYEKELGISFSQLELPTIPKEDK